MNTKWFLLLLVLMKYFKISYAVWFLQMNDHLFLLNELSYNERCKVLWIYDEHIFCI